MCKRCLLSLIIFAFPLALLGEDNTRKESPRPAITTYRNVQSLYDSDKPEGITGTYKKFTISPQTLPDPFLRYRLHILAIEKEVGNAYSFYESAAKKFREVENKALAPMYQSEEYKKLDPKSYEDSPARNRLKFEAFPLYLYWLTRYFRAETTAEKEAQLYGSLQEVFQLLGQASKKTYLDLSDVYKNPGVPPMPKLLQESRTLARYLASKANWEIRNGKFDEAVKTLRVGYALANHVLESQPNAAVNLLLGLAMYGTLNEQILYFSAQPDAPNLYPALMQIHIPNRIFSDSMKTEVLSPEHTQTMQSAWNKNQQTLDLLKIISALRYCAAVHEGQLPKSLDEITELTVPKIDIITGKPFAYKVSGNTATIDYEIKYNSPEYGSKSRIDVTVEASPLPGK